MDFFNVLSAAPAEGISEAVTTATDAAATDFPFPALTVAIFAVVFLIYVYASKAINAKKVKEEAPVVEAAPVTVTAAAEVYSGPVLTNVTEKEAAAIMAIVSDKTGIPLNRLRFDSIKLTEDK